MDRWWSYMDVKWSSVDLLVVIYVLNGGGLWAMGKSTYLYDLSRVSIRDCKKRWLILGLKGCFMGTKVVVFGSIWECFLCSLSRLYLSVLYGLILFYKIIVAWVDVKGGDVWTNI